MRCALKVRMGSTLLLLSLAQPALAALPDEIQVYDNEINDYGKRSVELHVNTTPSGNGPGYAGEQPALHTLRVTSEIAWGLGHHLETAIYLPTAFTNHGLAELAGLRGRLKWMPITVEDGEHGAYLGVSSELSRLGYRYEAARNTVELRGITGWRGERWQFAFNPVLGWGLTQGYNGAPDFSINTKLLRSFDSGIGAGVEYYATYGPVNAFLPTAQQSRSGYAIVEFPLAGGHALQLGVGRGWGAADRWTVKSVFEFAF